MEKPISDLICNIIILLHIKPANFDVVIEPSYILLFPPLPAALGDIFELSWKSVVIPGPLSREGEADDGVSGRGVHL